MKEKLRLRGYTLRLSKLRLPCREHLKGHPLATWSIAYLFWAFCVDPQMEM